jgi:hypothetical protein
VFQVPYAYFAAELAPPEAGQPGRGVHAFASPSLAHTFAQHHVGLSAGSLRFAFAGAISAND